MNEPFLKRISVQNFLSLKNISISLRNLTVFVGPNASGKSNTLQALRWLTQMMDDNDLPKIRAMNRTLWARDSESFTIKVDILLEQSKVEYELKIAASDPRILKEQLLIDGRVIIDVKSGEGMIYAENDEDLPELPFHPIAPELAIKGASVFGVKPKTQAISKFVKGWRIFDFQPREMRNSIILFIRQLQNHLQDDESDELLFTDSSGRTVVPVLLDWAENETDLFELVNQELRQSTDLELQIETAEDGDIELFLLEGYAKPIPLTMSSDGTMRLLAYYALLHHPKLPSLIAIEEPERNLHPAALEHIAFVIERIAEKTQVVITTHSSQLLDSLNSDNLGESLGIILFRNEYGRGTTVINLEEKVEERVSLSGWIDDFGIGSALFDSALIQ